MEVAFEMHDEYGVKSYDKHAMKGVPRVGELVVLGGEGFRVESVTWSPEAPNFDAVVVLRGNRG